jgi:hypothetical protein
MPIYSEHFPQKDVVFQTITLKDLIMSLPEQISYFGNIWLTGKVVYFGIVSQDLTILTDSEIANPKIETYFREILASFGLTVKVSSRWNKDTYTALKIYQDGKLMVDKETLTYNIVPNPAMGVNIITASQVKNRLPKTIPYYQTIYLTGGVVKNGWSANDVDFIVFDLLDPIEMGKLRHYFTNLLDWKVDIGPKVMTQKEPVYLYKVYENGQFCGADV